MPEVTSLQQVERPQLQGHHVQHSDAQHLLLIDGAVVPCTPGEYRPAHAPAEACSESLSRFLACSVQR